MTMALTLNDITNADDIADAITDGMLDDDLYRLRESIDSRLKALRAHRTVDDYHMGTKVKFNDLCGVGYLRGETATVVGRLRTKLVVTLDTPKGRFIRMVNGKAVSSEIRVPPSIIDIAR